MTAGTVTLAVTNEGPDPPQRRDPRRRRHRCSARRPTFGKASRRRSRSTFRPARTPSSAPSRATRAWASRERSPSNDPPTGGDGSLPIDRRPSPEGPAHAGPSDSRVARRATSGPCRPSAGHASNRAGSCSRSRSSSSATCRSPARRRVLLRRADRRAGDGRPRTRPAIFTATTGITVGDAASRCSSPAGSGRPVEPRASFDAAASTWRRRRRAGCRRYLPVARTDLFVTYRSRRRQELGVRTVLARTPP